MISRAVKKRLPEDLTSYDLLKTLAVIIMFIDHIGYYFFPDNIWWRVVGSSPPLWIGLIGYAQSRTISNKLLAGACLLLFVDVLLFQDLFSLNILFTVIFIRLTIDYVAKISLHKGGEAFWVVMAVLVVLWVPTHVFFAYGTSALIVALAGYALRHKDDLPDPLILQKIFIVALVSFFAHHALLFSYSDVQFVVSISFIILSFILLYNFKPKIYHVLNGKLSYPLKFILQLFGRRTLEVYVAHLVVFKVLSAYWGGLGWF